MSDTVPVTSIWLNRAERQRKELRGVEELAASISDRGMLINPILIKRDGELVAGERRWEAVKLLGWDRVDVRYTDEVDPLELQLLELEENIKRVDLTWEEECLALAKFHEMKQQQTPGWAASKTAEELHISPASLTEKLNVARALQEGNQMVKDAGKFSTAKGIVNRANERKAASAKIALRAATPGPESKPDEKVPPLLLADFHDWAASYSDDPFNFLHCDFPYGIGADKQQQGHQAHSVGSYSDTPDDYKSLLETLKRAMENVVGPSAHLMFWFSMDWYGYTKHALEDMGWAVNPFPLIWQKDDNTGLLPDPSRGPRRIYETCFIASRGDRKIVRAKSNAFSHPGKDKSIHMSEKPVPMLSYFMEMFVDEYTSILDPTCGSGNSIKAALANGAALGLGLEREPEFFNRAKEAFYAQD